MIIEKEIIINKGIETAWQVLGPQFADAYKWASAVNHSEGKGPGIHGATCSERGCSTSIGKLKEKILQYSDGNHLLSYQAVEGMPSMIKQATNTWQLSSIGQHTTKLQIEMKFLIGGFLGIMMKPIMRMQLSKMGKEMTEEFKYYVENGQPHPRKVKAMKKYRG